MARIFDLSATLDAGTVTSPTYTAKAADHGIQGVVSAGPMPDPTTTLAAIVQVSRDDGVTWEDVGGMTATGGLTGPREGPVTIPVTATALTFATLQKGWRVRAQATVTNPPAGGLPLTFQGDIF